MSGKRYLLDCTLRDGGYVNDWEFGRDNITNVFERLVSSGVDAIEIGFLDDRRPFDINRTIMPCTADAEKIFGRLDRGNAMVVGMIDYGTCSIDHLQECSDSWLDGIRVIFKQPVAREALEFCRQVKAKGYKVFAQLVSVTTYSDEDFKELIETVNDVHPYALSMVDTYGLLDPEQLTHIIHVIDSFLASDIILGFHAHNNFQLAFANAMTALNSGLKRDILVDGTLYGMGKSAGNAPSELIAMYMNEHYGKHYCITDMQEAITTSLMDIYRKKSWGYKLFFYIAAEKHVHPNYVSYLMNKGTLSVTEINEILSRIPEKDKLGKNMKLLEQIYLDYQKRECDDSVAVSGLKTELTGKPILVLGPGKTIRDKQENIDTYIKNNHPVVISVNFIPHICKPDYVFVSNSSRYLMMATRLYEQQNKNLRIIATSNVTRMEERTAGFDYVLNYSHLIDESNKECPDNSLLMLLRLFLRIGICHVALAGFDGYTPDDVNYVQENMEYSFVKKMADTFNLDARKFISNHTTDLDINFVTPSLYEGGDVER